MMFKKYWYFSFKQRSKLHKLTKTGWQKLFFILLLLIFSASVTYAQVTVSGTVTSAKSGNTLVGVNVLEKGTTNGTSTDADGQFELEVSGPDATLLVSYIGFNSKEINVGNQRTFEIQLEEDIEMLEDVVVVGYGEQDRRTLTSSVSSVSAEDIQNTPASGADQLMQGQAAGVEISSNSGTPGGGISINIRGTNSISGGSDPLYIVDGVPIETGNFGLSPGGGTTSAVADLDPSNIESIEVLKDASATAIYGARASNGVVIITTKRGSNSEPSIEVSSYYGFNQAVNTPDLVTGPEFEMLINESDRLNGEAETYDNPQSAINTDWASTVFRSGIVRNHDLTLSGGGETIQYSISGSNFSEDGVVKPATFDRSNLRVNLDLNATENLSFGTSIAYSHNTRNRSRNNDSITGVLGGVYFYPSNQPIYQDDGSYTKFSIFENPIVAAEEVDFDMNVNRLIGNVYGEYEFLPGLMFKTSWNYDYNHVKEDRYNNTFTNEGSAVNGSALSTVALNTNWTIENTLSYMFNVDDHNFSTLLGTSIQENEFERTTASGQQFPSNDFQRIADAAVQTSSSTGTISGLNSFFGRIKYDYDGKYLATVNVRHDGSSRFGENNRWGTFPSLALGWIASEESFFNIDQVSNLKLRASYGLTGNQSGINNFQARGLWGGDSYTDKPGTSPEQLANPNLKWETTRQLDLGLDIGLWDDRLNITYDYYHKMTEDLLLAVPVPITTGFQERVQNYGELENKGMELSISADIIRKQDFNWNAKFNIAGNRNKVLELASPFNVYNRDIYRYQEGYPMFSFYMHKQQGVDPETGDAIFEDVDGNGTFNPNVDRKIVGDANPDFFGGLRNNVNYKGFDLAVFLQYSYGQDQLNWNRFFQEHGGTRNTNFLSSQLDRWQEPGDQTMVPKMTSENYAGSLRPSRFVEDGSYMRLKDATLGYTLPAEIVSSVGISRLRFYVSGRNLLTFTNYSGLDPEVTATATTQLTKGIEFYTMPQAKSVIGGFDITF